MQAHEGWEVPIQRSRPAISWPVRIMTNHFKMLCTLQEAHNYDVNINDCGELSCMVSTPACMIFYCVATGNNKSDPCIFENKDGFMLLCLPCRRLIIACCPWHLL